MHVVCIVRAWAVCRRGTLNAAGWKAPTYHDAKMHAGACAWPPMPNAQPLSSRGACSTCTLPCTPAPRVRGGGKDSRNQGMHARWASSAMHTYDEAKHAFGCMSCAWADVRGRRRTRQAPACKGQRAGIAHPPALDCACACAICGRAAPANCVHTGVHSRSTRAGSGGARRSRHRTCTSPAVT